MHSALLHCPRFNWFIYKKAKLMKKLSYRQLGKTIVWASLIIASGLLANPASFFGQASVALAAQPPVPAKSATPTSASSNNLIIPNGAQVITKGLNLRRGPGTNFSIANVLSFGAVLTITNVSTNLTWINVRTSRGQTGWVNASPNYISLAPELDMPTVSATPLPTEIGPSPTSPPKAVPLILESRSLDGIEFGLTEFTWQWNGPLPANQGFEVRVWREGETPQGVHNAVLDNKERRIKALGQNRYSLTVDIRRAPGVRGPGNYLWTVLLVQIEPNYQELGIQAEPVALVKASTGFGFAIAAAPTPKYDVVRVFYGTDRNLINSSDPRRRYGTQQGPSFTYGIARVSIPYDHRLGVLEGPPTILTIELPANPEKHVVLLSADEQNKDEFFAALQARINSSAGKQAFVFVHGFNVTFENAARQTAQLAYDLHFDGAPILYSWPSDGAIPAYRADEQDAKATIPHLKTFLEDVARRTGATTIHIIAHSMGNQALTNVLNSILADSDNSASTVFHDIVLAAPDIDSGVFTRDIASQLTAGYPDKVTLYASARDKALLLSMMINHTGRVGYISGNPLIFNGMATIDVTDVDTSLLGHSYYADNISVLSDLFSLFTGKALSERHLVSVDTPNGKYWKIIKP
jgi:esterase/lipase superfamily enzyme